MKGGVSIKISNSLLTGAICQSSELGRNDYQFSMKPEELKIELRKVQSSVDTKDYTEYDISTLIELLEYLSFPNNEDINLQDSQRQFYLESIEEINIESEIKKQKEYFDTPTFPLINSPD